MLWDVLQTMDVFVFGWIFGMNGNILTLGLGSSIAQRGALHDRATARILCLEQFVRGYQY